jgi:hypothetical protein
VVLSLMAMGLALLLASGVAPSDNVSKGTTQADPTGAWSKTLDAVPDGSHTYTATTSDAAGNASTESEALDREGRHNRPHGRGLDAHMPIGKKVRSTAKPAATLDEAIDTGAAEARDA